MQPRYTRADLIERIVYTASLISRPQEVDPVLDTLRTLTARHGQDEQLSPADYEALLNVQQQLETYLLTKEQLRSFTRESLSVQIEQHMQGRTDVRSRLHVTTILILAPLAAFCAAFLPHYADVQQRGLVFGATLFSLITVGAGILFVTALSSFKSELRRAFTIIALAVGLLGLSLLGQPIMEIFDLRKYPLTSILYTLPILIAATLFHIGDAQYARLVGVRNFWTSARPVLLGCVILSLLTLLVPHIPTTEPLLVHYGVAVMWACMLVTPIASAIVLAQAMPLLPDLYRSPVRQLFLSMFPIIVVVAYQYVLRVVAGPYMEGVVAYILFGLVTCMGLMLLRAGYAFHKVSRY